MILDMFRRGALALAFIASGATAAAAQDAAPPPAKDAQAERMGQAFRDWSTYWGLPNGGFAVMRGEKVIGKVGLGGRDAASPEPVASLSKAITGVCIVKLVEAGELRYADRLGKLLPDYFKKNKPADPNARLITVSELLTQTGGVGYDPTQGTAEFAALNFSKANMPQQLRLALERPLTAKVHFYNNINYLALGMVIEAVTKTSYEEHCRKSVLTPVGAKAARIDPRWRIMSSWGGWRISAVEYARFLDHFRPKSKLLKTKITSWPKVDLGGGAYYSVGTMWRKLGSNYNLWHSGAWLWNSPKAQESYGAYFVVIGQDLRFVANFEPRPSNQAFNDLDYRVYMAANPAMAKARVPAAPDAPLGDALGGSDRGEADRAIGQSFGPE